MKGIYKYHVVDRCFPFLLVFSNSGNSNPPCGFIYHYYALKKDLVSLSREKMRAEEGCARSFSGFLSPTSCKQLSSHCLTSPSGTSKYSVKNHLGGGGAKRNHKTLKMQDLHSHFYLEMKILARTFWEPRVCLT